MRRVLIVILTVALIALTADTVRLKMTNSTKGSPPEEPGFWAKLIAEGRARRAQERREEHMATVSLIVALLALTTTGCTLYWSRRLRRNLSRVEGAILSSEQKQQLFESVADIQSLRCHADQLRRSLNEELERLKLAGKELDGKVTTIEQAAAELQLSGSQLHDRATRIERGIAELQLSGSQLDDRITKIEKACAGLGEMSEDLEELQGFKNHVEQLHSRLRQALNADSVKAQPLPGTPQIGLSRRA